MIPLAVTSTAWAIRKMGGKRWQALHRLIYFSAIAGVIHYIWLVKSDLTKPLQYGVILAVLLLYRVVVWVWPKGSRKDCRASSGSLDFPPFVIPPRHEVPREESAFPGQMTRIPLANRSDSSLSQRCLVGMKNLRGYSCTTHSLAFSSN